jgi:hypothetical protein
MYRGEEQRRGVPPRAWAIGPAKEYTVAQSMTIYVPIMYRLPHRLLIAAWLDLIADRLVLPTDRYGSAGYLSDGEALSMIPNFL